ncbi:hypothetical protein DM088_31715 [Klebsiella pneumoniae]|nr:hypothetical protein DM088_31715 [Klebsiella pneumoniae]
MRGGGQAGGRGGEGRGGKGGERRGGGEKGEGREEEEGMKSRSWFCNDVGGGAARRSKYRDKKGGGIGAPYRRGKVKVGRKGR